MLPTDVRRARRRIERVVLALLLAAAAATRPAAAGTPAQRTIAPLQASSAFLLSLSRALAIVAGRVGAGGAAGPECPAGGQLRVRCQQETPGGPPVYELVASDCGVRTAQQSWRANGSMRLQGHGRAECFAPGATRYEMIVNVLVFDVAGAAGSLTLELEDVSGTLSVGAATAPCHVGAIDATLSGEGAIEMRDAGAGMKPTQVRFDDLRLRTEFAQFGDACTPVRYTTTADGGLGLRAGGAVFAVLLEPLVLAAQGGRGETAVFLSGGLTSDCLPAAVRLASEEAVRVSEGGVCFRSGTVDLVRGADGDRLRFGPTGGVEIDLGRDGAVEQRFATCGDQGLALECGAAPDERAARERATQTTAEPRPSGR